MFLVNRASDGEWKDTVCVHTVENATSSSPAKKKKKRKRWRAGLLDRASVFFCEGLLSQDGGAPLLLSFADVREGVPQSLDVLFCRPYKLVA